MCAITVTCDEIWVLHGRGYILIAVMGVIETTKCTMKMNVDDI